VRLFWKYFAFAMIGGIITAWLLAAAASINWSHPGPAATNFHCDLAIDSPQGKLCFDRTDGHGNRIAFPQSEADAINSELQAACTAQNHTKAEAKP
jgi:hypothetical protein